MLEVNVRPRGMVVSPNSIWLRTPHGEPFIAVYEVAAEVVQPQAFIADIENTTTTGDMSGMNLSG